MAELPLTEHVDSPQRHANSNALSACERRGRMG